MKQTLSPNGELDILTADELDGVVRELLSGYLRPPQTMRIPYGDTLDDTGAAMIEVWTVPLGYMFNLHRLTVEADGYDPANPFINADGWIEIDRGAWMEDFVSLDDPGLPRIYTSGDDDAPYYTNGERIVLKVVGGPASTSLSGQIQGTLQPIASD